jgi:DNA-binding response OmpR family regulator
VRLSKKEFALLRTLAAEPARVARVFTGEELLRGLWRYQSIGIRRR